MPRIVWPFVLLLAACANAPTAAEPALRPALPQDLRAAVDALGPGVEAALWRSSPSGAPEVAWRADVPMPVASAIKVAYLVELFAAHADGLDLPLPGADAVLADDAHPAIAHLLPRHRESARRALAGASVRRIGEAMITGKGVDNATYNIAANLVTAHFGGPEGLQRRLHDRAPAWRGLAVRRYMLADRSANGDNTATAEALASVHGMLAAGAVPGVDPRALAAAREVLATGEDAAGRLAFAKGGSLDSEPVTRAYAGWRQGPQGAVVYVVMLSQSGVPAAGRAAAGDALAGAAKDLQAMLLEPGR